jgi:hypothetical protein
MTEQLVIHNFGPIREAEIEIKDLTVFVGQQATGKSMAAQLLYFMRGLESLITHPPDAFFDRKRARLVDQGEQNVPEAELPLRETLSGLEWWLGNSVSVYAASKTRLSWNPSIASQDGGYEIQWDEKGPRLNEALDRRVRGWFSSKPQVYIPAGRAIYSFLPPASALPLLSRSRPAIQWPGYILTFYETLGAAIKQLWQDQERGLQITVFEAVVDTGFARKRMDHIFKGQLRYGPDSVSLQVGEQTLRSETIAAGQMEIWPFWAILLETLRSGAFGNTRIYFEEPEAHLHPGAQRHVMEIVAYLASKKGQFVITTHSPYILYTINTCLMAHKVLSAGRDLPPTVPSEAALRPDQVAAYRFSADGEVHSIMDTDVGLIDEDELDRVADELGAAFTSLQERMEAAE